MSIKVLIFSAMILAAENASASWCPRIFGRWPDVWMHTSAYEFYYFSYVPFNRRDQEGAVFVVQNQNIVASAIAKGTRDARAFVMDGGRLGFSYASGDLANASVWFMDPVGYKQPYPAVIFETGHRMRPLVCTEDRSGH